MACYVLWIPSLENDLVIRQTIIKQYKLEDFGEPFTIDAEIDSSSFRIILKYEYLDQPHQIILSPFKEKRGCFLYYSVSSQTESESTLARSLESKLHQGLYDIIKKFFHKHTHHPNEEDSILHTRCFTDIGAYEKESKSDAEFYVEEYIKKFSFFNQDLDDCLEQIKEMRDGPVKERINYLNLYKAYKRIIDKLYRYKGEYLYYKSLRQSVSNVLRNGSKYDNQVKAICDEIEIKLNRVESNFNYTSSVVGCNISTVGLIISFIGLIIACITIFCNRNEKRLDGIEEKMELYHKQVSFSHKYLNDICEKQSELEEILNRETDALFDIARSTDEQDSLLQVVLQQQKIVERQIKSILLQGEK